MCSVVGDPALAAATHTRMEALNDEELEALDRGGCTHRLWGSIRN